MESEYEERHKYDLLLPQSDAIVSSISTISQSSAIIANRFKRFEDVETEVDDISLMPEVDRYLKLIPILGNGLMRKIFVKGAFFLSRDDNLQFNYLQLESATLVTCLAIKPLVQSDPNYCFSTDTSKPQLAMFSTKTSYDSVKGSSVNPNVSACTPSKFWLLQRHGTRIANANQISKFPNIPPIQAKAISNHDNGKGTLCPEDLELIRKWKLDTNITENIAEYLTLAGWIELENIASRYQFAFPTLLPSTYDRSKYLFQHTDTQRTQASFRAFADGLFGYNGYLNVVTEPIPARDLLLRPYDFCDPWLKNSGLETEMAAFEKGAEYDIVISNVNKKLGGTSASKSNVRSMWQLCRFEQAADLSKPAPWCSVFSVDDVKVLEYGEDLGYYYEAGYGFNMNKNVLCEAMQNLLNFLKNDKNEAPARILVSHSTSMQLLLVALGLYEDETPLTRSNFAEQQSRKWRTSQQTAFASNLAVVRYDCQGGDHDVLFLYNEHPLQIPGCQPNGLCKLSYILKKYNRFLSCRKDIYGSCNISKEPASVTVVMQRRRQSKVSYEIINVQISCRFEFVMESIPVIDLDFFTKSEITESVLSDVATKRIAEEIRFALHEVGFMYLINHRVSPDVIDNAFTVSKSFFDLDLETKAKYKKIPVVTNHGWIQAGQELLHPKSVFELREGFDFVDATKVIKECPHFTVDMAKFKTACEQFARKVLLLLSFAFQIDDVNFFLNNCTHLDDSSVANECDMRAIYYPPIPQNHDIPEGTVRCASHTDYELMTFLFQDNVGGLEVRRTDGSWLPATPIPGSILVNTGDLLERWTSGYFPATKHRVVIPLTEIKQRIPRYSFAYFFAPDNDAVVSPIIGSSISQSVNGRNDEPITAFEHIMNRVKEAYKY
ncbi:Multiple inositol polyphosphate phosphatase 1 [Pseudolycoriella hygida]|uniref:Multiple inositol polyphosphate phosphatase 1 n=1 Tax=Pseudolycoriella hygida TaxID=35572 RepID=A0A9Q0MJH3_9DIPT|nr:Multiple inositol polyphosphate phosphatase 1 [Pseudolycoriella hygida]